MKVLLVVGMMVAQFSFAKDDGTYLDQGDKRQEKLNFESGLVEGMDRGRNELGTVTNKDKAKGRKQLYRKMMSFEKEMDSTLKDLGY